MLAGCLLPGPPGTWLLAIGAALLPAALIALGVRAKERSAGSVRLLLAALTLLLFGTLGALIQLHRADRAGAIGLLLLLAGIWFLPLLLTGIGHAVTFSRTRSRAGGEPGREPER